MRSLPQSEPMASETNLLTTLASMEAQGFSPDDLHTETTLLIKNGHTREEQFDMPKPYLRIASN